ncbi:MAG: bifunctional demethylmenaquinone methyltransferase/2-methoxy-6-polyprenyl-1,4-benzoquinol methylase UbiE [Myxococcales bacterium]|nr:bifunctional demethylmenaquinone methyltransferase/2-methoxy-6-polyprenyl-1,4-benzoquinol methylase UbiE [Myxococcales bacterium]
MSDQRTGVNVQEKDRTWQMFDRIASTYDPLNRMLSAGIDVRWRKRVAKHLPSHEQLHLLDLATGTGDLLITLCKEEPRIQKALGMDLSEGMLAVGREKLQKLQLPQPASLETGDATQIPVEDQSFDAVTIAFGIRNVNDVPASLREMHRVLRPKGRAIILEFSLPKSRLMRGLYLFYFRRVLPMIGSMVSGDRYAYSYLNQSVEAFPYGEAFCQMMRDAGFADVKATPLTFGIATIYQGDKLPESTN